MSIGSLGREECPFEFVDVMGEADNNVSISWGKATPSSTNKDSLIMRVQVRE